MGRHIIIFIMILVGLTACKQKKYSGQSEIITIENSDFDFGIVPDSIQVLHHRFMIENKSSDTCHIIKIEKSCGCTKVKVSNNTIFPHSSVCLNVEVDLGSNYNFFERDINIYTDMFEQPKTIYIRASRQMPVRIARKEFPVKVTNDLRINTPYVILGNIGHGQQKSAFINILNTSNKKMSFSASVINAPSYISIYSEEEINSYEIGRIIITFDLSNVKTIWGLQKYFLQVKTGGSKREIPVEAIFTEDITIKKTDARILIPTTNYTINTTLATDVTFNIRNVGTDTLHVRNIQVTGQTKKISLSSYKICPYGLENLNVKFNKRQKGNIEIGLTTNDMKEPYKIIRIFCKPA